MLPAEAFRPVNEVAAPPGLMNLPVRPDLFVGRDEVLADLRAALTAEEMGSWSGWAGRHRQVHAGRLATRRPAPVITPGVVDHGRHPGHDRGGAGGAGGRGQPALSRALPLEALREWALQWLACHDGWLLVLDNVNHPADIAPLTGRVATGRFLITSRLATGWHAITSSVVRLDVLSADNAVDLLTRIAPRQGGRCRGALR